LSTQGTTPKDNKTALVVIIDNGNCTVSLLVENLTSHMKHFGERAAYLILSTRGGELLKIWSEIFRGPSEFPAPPIGILDSKLIEEARQLIVASELVFFIDAEIEIRTPFFLSACRKLVQEEQAIVSCATAVRHNRGGVEEIEELPTGDIPGLAALGQPI